jgi:F-type H+-transporting ATPase subunit b
MNILLMPATQMLAMTEGAGGLFDFNATLPVMAIQVLLLTIVLTFVYFKPISKVIDERETYINGNLTTAAEKLIKADELYNEYDEQLKTARVNAQSIIAKSEKEAKEVVSVEINQARQEAAKLLEKTNKELEAQKSLALQQLETQVDELSQLIKEKVLGKEVVL